MPFRDIKTHFHHENRSTRRRSSQPPRQEGQAPNVRMHRISQDNIESSTVTSGIWVGIGVRGVPGVVVADVAHLHILGPVWSSGQADQHVAGGHPPWSGGGGGGWGESDKHGGVRWLVRTGPAAAAGNHLRHHYHRSSRRTICVGDGRWAMGGVACLQPPFTFFFSGVP